MTADAELRARFDPVDDSTPGRARRTVLDYAERHVSDTATLEAIALCVTETVTNVVLHAYRDRDTAGPAVVEASLRDSGLWITVRDDGCGLSPGSDSAGLGMGLPLVSASTAHLEIRTGRRRGTEIRMKFETAIASGSQDEPHGRPRPDLPRADQDV